MEIISKFKLYLQDTLYHIGFGMNFTEFVIIFIALFFSLIIRGIFANIVILKIKKIIKKTGNKIDDKLFDNLAPPLKLLPIIFVFIFISIKVNLDTQLGLYFEKINKTLVTIFIFWFLHQSLIPISELFQKFEKLLSKALVLWLIRSIKYLVVILGFVAVLETWGIKIGPVIAGLGLFGVAVALGAQDLFKNLISGIMIILEKRFQINDIIEIPNKAIGCVEHIGFRSTLIRQFDTTPITIPNYVFSDSSVINYSERKYRRIKWIIGLTYNTTIDQLKIICEGIENSISSSKNFVVNDLYHLNVRVEKFNDSSIDILVNTFTNTNDWDEYLKIKEELVYIVKEVVESNNSSFAFPSQSLYIEKK